MNFSLVGTMPRKSHSPKETGRRLEVSPGSGAKIMKSLLGPEPLTCSPWWGGPLGGWELSQVQLGSGTHRGFWGQAGRGKSLFLSSGFPDSSLFWSEGESLDAKTPPQSRGCKESISRSQLSGLYGSWETGSLVGNTALTHFFCLFFF